MERSHIRGVDNYLEVGGLKTVCGMRVKIFVRQCPLLHDHTPILHDYIKSVKNRIACLKETPYLALLITLRGRTS